MRIKNKRGRGKTRQWIGRRDERGYFNNIVKELAIEDTAEYKDMMRMSHAVFQRILSYIEQDITRKQVIYLSERKISPDNKPHQEPDRLLATHKILLLCYRLFIHGYVFLIAHAFGQQC